MDLNYKSKLSNDIKNEYNKLLDTILKVADNDRFTKNIEGTSGKVSVNDIIAYQIGWITLLIGWYEAGIKNKDSIMPGDGFKTWDYNGLAIHFYKKYQYKTSAEYINNFSAVVKKIIKIVETEHESGNLDKLGVWKWLTLKSGKQWPFSKWVTINTVAPFKRARTMIMQSRE